MEECVFFKNAIDDIRVAFWCYFFSSKSVAFKFERWLSPCETVKSVLKAQPEILFRQHFDEGSPSFNSFRKVLLMQAAATRFSLHVWLTWDDHPNDQQRSDNNDQCQEQSSWDWQSVHIILFLVRCYLKFWLAFLRCACDTLPPIDRKSSHIFFLPAKGQHKLQLWGWETKTKQRNGEGKYNRCYHRYCLWQHVTKQYGGDEIFFCGWKVDVFLCLLDPLLRPFWAHIGSSFLCLVIFFFSFLLFTRLLDTHFDEPLTVRLGPHAC